MSVRDLNVSTSSSVDEGDEAAATKFLRNLSGIGALCTFEELNKIKNPILAGKITKIEPFKSNADVFGPNIMVVTLREVFSIGSKKPREFLVFFFKDAAKSMMQSKLNMKEYIAIHRPVLIRNPIYIRPPQRAFTVVLMVGSPTGNSVEDVYGRAKRMEDWRKLLEINVESPRKSVKRKRPISPLIDEPENEVQVIEPPEISAIQLNDSDEEDIIQSTPDAPTGRRMFRRAEREEHTTPPNEVPEERHDVATVDESANVREPLEGAEDDVIPNTQDAGADLQDVIPNTQDASADLRDVIPNAQDANADLQDVIPNAQDANADLQDVIPNAQDANADLQDVIPNAQDASADLQDVIPNAQDASADLQDVVPNAQDASADLRTVTPTRSPEPTPNETHSSVNGIFPREGVRTRARGLRQLQNKESRGLLPLENTESRGLLPLQNTESVRLKDARLRMNITVFGVIINHRDLRLNDRGRFVGKIGISDETCENFPVEFYLTTSEVPIHLRQFDVIKLIDMEIKSYQNKLYGKITQTRNVVTYARENPAIKHNQTQSYEYTSQDRLRVKKLIRWMQKNVLGAHMFTRLCDIKNNSTSLCLLGTVVGKKFYKARSMLLRLRDGTSTTQFFREHDLSKETLHSSTKEVPVEGSDFVDITVLGTTPKFVRFLKNEVQIGSVIELNNVHALRESFTYKGKKGSAIRLHFMADEKHIRIRESDSQLESQVLSESVPHAMELENADQSESQEDRAVAPKRRKLFNEEELITTMVDETTPAGVERRSPEPTNEGRPNTDGKVETEISNEEVKEEASICIPFKVAVPRLDDLSEVRTVPNSPEPGERNEDALSARADLEKAVIENLVIRVKALVSDVQKSEVSDELKFQCLEQWPHDTRDEFWIKVSLVSTLPVITSTSDDTDILSLVSVHCERCKKYTPFLFVSEWKMADGGCAITCPSCQADGEEVRLRYLMNANLLVKDGDGAVASAIVTGRAAEKFFGCTLAELVLSKETQFRVKNLMLNSNTLTLKLKAWETTARSTRYIVLARRSVI